MVGLGYVGLPLAVAAANSNFLVSGIDADEVKILGINSGASPIEDIADLDLKKLVILNLKMLVINKVDSIYRIKLKLNINTIH